MDSSEAESRLRQAGLFVARVASQHRRREIEATPELDIDLMRLAAEVEMKMPFLFPSSPSSALSLVNSASSAASSVNSSSSAASLVNSSSVANESVPRRVVKGRSEKSRSEKSRSESTREPPLPDSHLRRSLRSKSRSYLSNEYGAVAHVRQHSTAANGETGPVNIGPGSKVDACLAAWCWLVERPDVLSFYLTNNWR